MPKAYVPNDRFAKRAQYQGYRARSVYKLEELDKKFHLFKPQQKVLDVGAFPGSWLQYVAIQVGERGRVVGVDLQKIQPVAPNVEIIQQDITDTTTFKSTLEDLEIDQFDLVISDIAPSTTGIPGVDQAKSVQLSQMVVEVADEFLRPKGTLVMKVFEGSDFGAFFNSLKSKFGFVTAYKAKASRDRSIEKYIVCQRKRG
jgi:23S rRNA (uridine2552-2'-O)-methyltransferase